MTGPADREDPPAAAEPAAVRFPGPGLPALRTYGELVDNAMPEMPKIVGGGQMVQIPTFDGSRFFVSPSTATVRMTGAMGSPALPGLLQAGTQAVLQQVFGDGGAGISPPRRAVKTRQFVAAATEKAQEASTIAEFGDALRALHTEVGWTQNQLAQHFEDRNDEGVNIAGLSKTRISNACNGYALFQTEDQVRHFVIACRAAPDLKVWIAAYRRAKENGGRRATGPAHHEPTAPPARTAEPAVDAAPPSLLSGPDEEVVHVLQVPITRGQVRAALVLIATLGVVASSSSTPTIRAVGLTALGFAAATAVADRTIAARQPPPHP